MNLVKLSLRSVLFKPLSSALSVLLFGFGISIIVLILLASTHLKNEINKNASGIDLVIGAKGSPLQLILANIFHVDFPTGNISLKEAAQVSRNRLIRSAIPLALGDSYGNYRIVGTTSAYLDLYGGELAEGSVTMGEMQAVVGASVAEKLGLKVGDEFASAHGLSDAGGMGHDEHPFTVEGILAPSGSVLDDLILVSINSVWHVHGHAEGHDEHAHEEEQIEIKHLGLTVTQEQFENEEITSLLVQYASPMGAVRLPQAINKNSNFQAASPAFETARLFSLIGTGVEVVNILGIVIIVISAISVFIALVNSLKERKYELAIMRSMGASRLQVFVHVLLEGIILTCLGILLGFGMAHGGFLLMGQWVPALQVDGLFFVEGEGRVLLGSFAVGCLSALVPALLAYRADISQTLAKG